MTTAQDVEPRVWNAIAHAAIRVFDRPLFSRRNAMVCETVDALAEAGYVIVRMDRTGPSVLEREVLECAARVVEAMETPVDDDELRFELVGLVASVDALREVAR